MRGGVSGGEGGELVGGRGRGNPTCILKQDAGRSPEREGERGEQQ